MNIKKVFQAAGFFSLMGMASSAWAQRWTLLSFQCDANGVRPQFGTQFPDWNEFLMDPVNVAFVNENDVCGVTERVGAPHNVAYFGVRGTNAIPMTRANKIILTFYNNDYPTTHELRARVSVNDADGPETVDSSHFWNTAYPEGVPRELPGGASRELVMNITDASSVLTMHNIPTEGDRTLISVSMAHFNSGPGDFVLTRIEFSNEADMAPPDRITDLQARPISVSPEAGTSAVELTWTRPADHGTNGGPAAGASRYFIYRDGVLFDLVNKEWSQFWGGRVVYRDLHAVPGTSHTYEVTALDDATTGMYPVILWWSNVPRPGDGWNYLDRMNLRCGNESPRSNTATATTPGWASTTLLNPYVDMSYQGAFRMPLQGTPEDGDPNNDIGWGYSAQALAFYPRGNSSRLPTEQAGSLYAAGHDQGERLGPEEDDPRIYRIGEISIPRPVISQNRNMLPRARNLRPQTSPYPFAYGRYQTPPGSVATWRRLLYHPGDPQAPEGLYYSIFQQYTGDANAPVHGWFNLDMTQSAGPWHVGGLPGTSGHVANQFTAKFLMTAPQAWAERFGGRSFLVGLGWEIAGVGWPSCGPTLYATTLGGSLPAAGTALSAVKLLQYASYNNIIENVGRWEYNWNQNTGNHSAVWVSAGGKDSVVITAARPVGDEWYGADEGLATDLVGDDWPSVWDARNSVKGPRNSDSHPILKFYNPLDLARVAQGGLQPHQPQPYAVFDLQDTIKGEVRSVTYDAATGSLFVSELTLPFYQGEYQEVLIHVWKVDGIPPPPPAPPARPRRLRVRS